MQTIPLPAGTVPVADIPALLARAKYPPVPSRRVVSYLARIGTRSKRERPLSRLASDVLCRVWACAPLAWEGWTEAEWARRAADLDRSPFKPKGWALVPVWRNDELNAAVLRADAECMYRDKLHSSIARGEVVARNHAGVRSQGFPDDTVDAESLRTFAASLRISVRVEAPTAPERTSDEPQDAPAKPVQRSAAQDAAILAAIRSAGHDPLNLPTNKPGRPGVKAAMRDALRSNPLFVGTTVFPKAWDRLRERGELADAKP